MFLHYIVFLRIKSQQLTQQVSSGGFTSTMQSKARSATPPVILLTHANCSTVAVDPFKGVIFVTNSPSISPESVPAVSASKASTNSYGSWPLYGQVGRFSFLFVEKNLNVDFYVTNNMDG